MTSQKIRSARNLTFSTFSVSSFKLSSFKNATLAFRNFTLSTFAGLFALLLISCNPKSEKISFGKDSCSECKMTIMDPKFGGEIVTKKGKVYKFDDVHCIATFLQKRGVELSDIHQTLFNDYNKPGSFITAGSAEFLVSSELKSPMGGNAVAFKTGDEAKKKSAGIDGSKVTNWATLYNILVK
jgi:copper chaperone NosL